MTGTIQAVGLRKRYGRVAALDGLDLTVAQGDVVGLLGPNGAGKTTALRILVGLVRADAGSVAIEGRAVDRSWVGGEQVGAMIALPVFYPHLSGRDNLRVVGTTWGWPRARIDDRISSVLAMVDLSATGGRSVKGYSTGMRQRLGIALALLADPPIIILDEPVNGLDPAGIVEIRDLLMSLAGTGRTILLSSHLLTEVERTCDHVAIVDRGRILAEGTPAALSGGGSDRVEVRIAGGDGPAARRVLEAAGLRVSAALRATGATNGEFEDLRVEGARRGSDVARLLAAAGLYPDRLAERRDSLEDVFLRLTDHHDEDTR
ncbi:MAG: ABC transporter ATP-binding protein [Candidatus Limnocylindrales bacterium]